MTSSMISVKQNVFWCWWRGIWAVLMGLWGSTTKSLQNTGLFWLHYFFFFCLWLLLFSFFCTNDGSTVVQEFNATHLPSYSTFWVTGLDTVINRVYRIDLFLQDPVNLFTILSAPYTSRLTLKPVQQQKQTATPEDGTVQVIKVECVVIVMGFLGFRTGSWWKGWRRWAGGPPHRTQLLHSDREQSKTPECDATDVTIETSLRLYPVFSS